MCVFFLTPAPFKERNILMLIRDNNGRKKGNGKEAVNIIRLSFSSVSKDTRVQAAKKKTIDDL